MQGFKKLGNAIDYTAKHLYNGILAPTGNMILRVLCTIDDYIFAPIGNGVEKLIITLINYASSGIRFTYYSIIKPIIYHGLIRPIKFIYNSIIIATIKALYNKIFVPLLKNLYNYLLKLATGFFDYLIKPIAKAIVRVLKFIFTKLYTILIKPVFKGLWTVIKLIFRPFLTLYKNWIYNGGTSVSKHQYRLGIKPGQVYYDNRVGEVVLLKEGQKYKLQLTNNVNSQCNCIVTIDGKEIGIFRLKPYSRYTIERPVNDVGYFTFYKDINDPLKPTSTANPADAKGIITARFIPEGYGRQNRKNRKVIAPSNSSAGGIGIPNVENDEDKYSDPYEGSSGRRSKSGKFREYNDAKEDAQLVKGITKFEGESLQQFTTVNNIQLAENAAITITLRLAAFRDDTDAAAKKKSN